MSIVVTPATKPNRVTDSKGEKYHLDMGRWAFHHANNALHAEYLRQIQTNRNFARPNRQWEMKSDYDNFLLDKTGNTNNREKIEMNYINIMVNHLVGNACRMSVRSSAHPFSVLAKTRKEESLQESLLWYNASVLLPQETGEVIRANKAVGRSESETVAMHENYYCDKFLLAMNNLMRYSENVNNFELIKREVAEHMAIDGMSIIKPEAGRGEYWISPIDPSTFLFDRGAKRTDLSDAEYMGDYSDALVTEIFERIQTLSDEQRVALETKISSIQDRESRVRVYKMYWRDVVIDDWGYVTDEFDQVVFDRINYTHENETKPRYTKKDLVPYSQLTEYQKKVCGNSGQSFKKTYTDQWRFVEFVPSEYIGYTRKPENGGDLVLDYGIMPYQEPNIYSPYNMETPYKVAMYMYIEGQVHSPIEIAISPQRVANRIMSVVENLINNAGGNSLIFAKESVAKSDYNIDDLAIRLKNGEPIELPAQAFGGIQNAVWQKDMTIGKGVFELLNVSTQLLQLIENSTGVNHAMKGQTEGNQQLVGTMQLMIQRGTVVTERYYSSLREIFRQTYQAVVTSGKRYYINEKPKLASVVGDEGADVIVLSKDMTLETFRVKVVMEMDEQSERNFVDTTLFTLMQGGLIDKTRFGRLIGRGRTDEMWASVRDHMKELTEAERQQSEMMIEAQGQEQQTREANINRAFESQDMDREAKMIDSAMKYQSREQQ